MPGKNILVIDDTKVICTYFKKELGKIGYKVDSALSGQAAIKKAKSKKYNLIFIDFIMPGLDGVKTCKILKKISPASRLIFMTGNVDPDLNRRAMLSFIKSGGEVHYLYKPFLQKEIVKITKEVLGTK